MSSLRIGTVPYLNAHPLVYGLQDDPEISLIEEIPVELAGSLREARLDAALVPIVSYFELQDQVQILYGPGVMTDGPARSVRLIHRVHRSDLTAIYRDPSSRTSNLLLAVLASTMANNGPLVMDRIPGVPNTEHLLHDADGFLVIGDPALHPDLEQESGTDLGSWWKELTDTGFIFAAWLIRKEGPTEVIAERLLRAADEGLTRRKELAARFAQTSGHSPESLHEYLTDNILYEMNERSVEGLNQFWERAAAIGLAPDPSEIDFFRLS